MDNEEEKSADLSLYEMLQRISKGSFDPKHLTKDDRQALVQVLILRGQEQIAIARLLKVSDRTIRRDAREIWEQNALTRDPEFTKKFVGQVYLRAMSFVETLTRLGHSSEGMMFERNQAMSLAWRSLKELFEKLQSLGYLPFDQRRVIPPKEVQPDKPGLPKSKKMSKEDKEERALLQEIEATSPMERDRLRKSLEKRILELSRQGEGEDAPPSVPTPEVSPPKDDEDPGAACGAAT